METQTVGTEIRFQFDRDKAIQTMAYLVGRLRSVQKVKLMKLVYLADKLHFLSCGYPITGDRQWALPHGPVPSETLDLLNANIWPDPEAAYKFLHVNDATVTLKQDPGTSLLSSEELATLDEILVRYGDACPWALVEQTHALPEYKEAYAGGIAGPIPYELILRHAGDDRHDRLGRPVASAATVAAMLCPLNAGADADL